MDAKSQERQLTPSELEDITIARIEHGAVGQNAVACGRCNRTIEHIPNDRFFKNCLVMAPYCDWCEHREENS